MIIRAFDIETVPDLTVWTPPKPDPLKPDYQPFAPPHAHQVVAIAWVDLDGEPRPDGEERFLPIGHGSLVLDPISAEMRKESQLLHTWKASCKKSQPMFVSWNGRRFDGPVMALRAMKHEIPWSWWWTADPSYRYRYSEVMGHVDLCDVLADFGAAPMAKLGDMARLCQMPGKPDMDGLGVADELSRGNTKKVANYCLLDAVQTAGIYVRHQFQRGIITRENMINCLDLLEETIEHRYQLYTR